MTLCDLKTKISLKNKNLKYNTRFRINNEDSKRISYHNMDHCGR